jgi:hypothetical protein
LARERAIAILLVYLPLLEARRPKYFGFKNQMYRERIKVRVVGELWDTFDTD